MHSRCTQLCIHSRRMSEAFRTYAFPLFPNSETGRAQYINSLSLQPVNHVTTVFLLLL